jgi:hypothetical protein
MNAVAVFLIVRIIISIIDSNKNVKAENATTATIIHPAEFMIR